MRRFRFRKTRPRRMWIGPIVAAVGWLVAAIGYNNAIQSFWHGGALLIVLGAVISVLGVELFRVVLPAVILVAVLVPVPGMARQRIAIPMQLATAKVTQQVCEVVGMAVIRSGSLMKIVRQEGGTEGINIAEACNGLRMVFALILVSYALAFGSPYRWYVRVIILLTSPILAICCNVIRLVPTVWVFDKYPKHAHTFHDVSGYAMLVVAFLLLFGILRLLRWSMVPLTRYTLAYD